MVHRTRPDDFIVRFSHHEDLELFLVPHGRGSAIRTAVAAVEQPHLSA